jgi:aspartate-semialdehyde dehydrogenase
MLVEETTENVFKGADLVLFAGKEGASGASVTWRKTAEKAGTICIDNGRDFRLAEDVPLVVPEVNADAISEGVRFIASPNCSTIQLVVALAPIHRAVRIKRIIVSSYQSTSGWGVKGPEELRRQTPMALESLENITFDPTVFARPIAFNCIPHIEPFMEENYTREELKLVYETRKILGDQNIQISATSVRVPVFVGHGESIWIETEKPVKPEEAYDILKNSPGIILMDDLAGENPRGDKNERNYPTLLDVHKYRDEVLVGRIRKDLSCPNGLVLWCVADNLRKGAALNVVQIAEELIQRNILKQ